MAEKETVGVRLPTDRVEEIEQIAEDNEITKSDAVRRVIREGLKLNKSGITVAAGNNFMDKEGKSKAESPLNETDPYTLLTLVLTIIITLNLYGIL